MNKENKKEVLLRVHCPFADYRKAQKRQMGLLEELANTIRYKTAIPHFDGYFTLAFVNESSKWFRETYVITDIADGEPRKESTLYNDLAELGRKELIYFSACTDRDKCGGMVYCPDPLRWSVGIHPAGIKAIEEHHKHWLRKAYEKQPMTALQIIVTVFIALITFFGGYMIGKGHSVQTGTPATTQPATTEKVS